MKKIIVITDSAKIADVEFKSLRQRLMDKELLVKSDDMRCILYTAEICIRFWNTNSSFPIISFDTFAYSNCKIGIRQGESIMYQIRKWQIIERLVEHMPPNAKEIPYSDIENLKIWELLDLR